MIRKAVIVLLSVFAVVAAGALYSTTKRCIVFRTPTWIVGVASGALWFGYDSPNQRPLGWTVVDADKGPKWCFLPRVFTQTNAVVIGLPLWILFFIFSLHPTIAYIRARRRRTPGVCSNCAFDLTGNESGMCPECGFTIEQP